MQPSVYKLLSFLFLASIIISSCDTTDPFRIPPPDFSTVPPAFSIEGEEPVVVEPGVTAYVLEEGTGSSTVTVRDQISMVITLRTLEDEIIFSTFSSGRTDPVTVSVGGIQLTPQVFTYSVALAYTPGLRKGLVGMKEGEVRTLIVEPSQGFGDMPSGAVNSQYRESTLQYDIEITRIAN
jgi:FKBP-type peptidyl-prolyl cis-trans isomerase